MMEMIDLVNCLIVVGMFFIAFGFALVRDFVWMFVVLFVALFTIGVMWFTMRALRV